MDWNSGMENVMGYKKNNLAVLCGYLLANLLLASSALSWCAFMHRPRSLRGQRSHA